MESGDLYQRKEVSGHFPEYGAIFMSNRSTFKECLEKRLLGLPGPFSSFVRCVKAGMILFLFEFEERKLYGVFEAISDGGMDIVPHAYISSGRKFPAQVKFTTIWHCDPLFEDEFRDAIRDNYFNSYKFNFGLSKDQKEGNSHISAKESQDYIPLSSSDHSDSEEEGVDFSECSVVKQIESSIPIPQFAHGNILSNKRYNKKKMEHSFASTHGSPSYRLDDSSNVALPLSDTCNSKSKGMYFDKSKERSSVFSRLNFSSKHVASKNQNDGSGELANDMSIVKHQNHKECKKKKKVTRQKQKIGDCNTNKRTSVFLRLTGPDRRSCSTSTLHDITEGGN